MEYFMGKAWYTTEETAKELGISKSHVNHLGKIYKKLELQEYFAMNKNGVYRPMNFYSKESVEAYKNKHDKNKSYKNDKKSIEDLEIDRICHELLDGFWNWMCDHMDDILLNGIEVSMRVPNNKELGVFHGISKPCIDSKLEEIMKEREEYYENGRD